jgi:hypothetical protein
MNDTIGCALRGDPTTLRQTIAPSIVIRPGYFGTLYTVDDPELYANELPTKVFNVAGHMILEIPAIVPSLTRQEITHLVVGGQPTWGMIEKAKAHALQRIQVGKSPFAGSGEQRPLPKE